MSDIKIQPSGSGTAVVTLTAPATNTARTITFPDATGTLINTGSDLPAANLTGTVADARISALTASKLTGALPAISAASLTAIPAANITGTLPAISAANLTAIPAANITGTLPAISGANLTNLPSNTPSFSVLTVGEVAMTDGVLTKITFATERFDNGGNFDLANNKFIVPAGGAGDYIFIFNGVARCSSNSLSRFDTAFYKNGSAQTGSNTLPSYIISGAAGRNWDTTLMYSDTLADADYIEVFMNVNGASNSSTKCENPQLSGFKLIE